MADNVDDHQRIEKKFDRSCSSRNREQRVAPKLKDKVEESQLPAPPPDPWVSPWCVQNTRNQAEATQPRSLEEDDDIIAYLTDFGMPPHESQTSECPSRNSATSTMAISNLCMDDAFEHLDRLYAFTEQILELRSRSSKFFKRVRNLEKMKVLRNADRRLENVFARDKDTINDICDEDTGFAESLLDAMLSNCRDPLFQRRYTRSTSRQARSKFDVEKQTSVDEIAGSAPKVSKWTRVKAAFKWERACTNDIVEGMDTTMTGSLSTSAKYHRNLDTDVAESNSTPVSPCTNEASDIGTPFGRTSSASSSNEGSYDYLQRNISNHSGCQSSKLKTDKKIDCTNQRSQSLDGDIVTLNNDGDHNIMNMGKPLIRVTSEKNHPMHSLNKMDERDTDSSSKRFTPTLTITIPSHEEEMRCMSSPDSSSPLPSSAHTSGGNSPQPRKIHREFSMNKDFKRQLSTNEDSTTRTPKTQRQNSKWNKVRRAFLTNSTLSVPPNLIRVVSRQMLLQDGLEASLAYGYSNSTEDLQKTPLTAETRRDYRALREKLGAEFHRKLIEWERLKNLSPRVAKDSREISSNLVTPRETLPSEERLAPEFRKKLQDWKRTKKDRRGSAPFEQQRLNRRRLTDWQLWRSPSKSEYRNKERGCYEENTGDVKSHLGEDFVRKMEIWKKMNDSSNRDAKHSQLKSNRLGISSEIDESEFLALERVVSLFDSDIGRGRRGSDARRLDECFDGDLRPYIEGTQNANDTNEVLIRTSVGSYRFEGISREFTRKLYDWERYRGISPTSSTFRLLGPAYDSFTRNSTIETSTVELPTTKVGNDEPSLFKVTALKRSKSTGSLMETVRDEFFIRRSTSLQTLGHAANRLKDNERIDTLPASIDSQRTEDIADIVMDDSEPEAMIVDIEDVIEETASPLERVQPHQTPVYSVAASETTSIAVPLGTVTSSHEPSPVFLIEIEETEERMHWESKKWRRKSFSSEDSLSTEHSEKTKIWNNKRNVSNDDNVDSERSSITESLNENKHCLLNMESFDRNLDKDSIKSDSSIYSIELDQKYKIAGQSSEMVEWDQSEREEISVPSDGDSGITVTKYEPEGTDEISHERNLGNHFAASIKEMMDLSSNKKHEQDGSRGAENDRSTDNGKDAIEAKMKCDNEYEEIGISPVNLRCCSSTDVQPNYSKEYADTLPESVTKCKLVLDETKYPLSEMGLRRVNRDDERFNKHEENYGVIRDEVHNQTGHNLCKMKSNLLNYKPLKSYEDHEEQGSCTKPVATTVQSETREQQYHNFENVLSSVMLRTNSCSSEYHREPTIKTTPCTVAPCREERCFKRMIINEETLNKIVVPTASTGCIEKSKDAKPVQGSSEDHNRSNTDRELSSQEGAAKKRVSPSRNVFIKTKRIIFSPFRRVEDSVRKESIEEDQPLSIKSKSKSRSASPKISRHDGLLRMSLSLPWPLRPSSKDRELRETKIKENDKVEKTIARKENSERCKSVESTRKSITEKNQTRNSSIELTESESRQFFEQKSQRVSVSVQATPDQQDQTVRSISSCILKNDEKKCDDSKFDPNSSDLIHKLNILSNVVARRDGRTISEESSVESHSLRIRRAKEDFLSRRGGPLCHSVLEPRSFKSYEFPRTSAYRCEEILEKQPEENEKLPVTSREETSKCETREKMNEKKMEFFGNKYELDNSVSRPDRVKSASVGMINVDPDTFVRLTETNRGCESLPRSIVKQQEPLGPLAKIVNKLKFTKLIRSKDIEVGNMSTISKLCRQSLLIDVRNDFEKFRRGNDRRGISSDNINQFKKEG
nr:PREDICTED: uncharacterized protein LOC100878328 isoform X1 [Megachile rotundata]